jgi:predicted metalloendopeptidase
VRLLDEAEPAALRAYLRWHVARACAAHLPKPFVDGAFEFFAKARHL